MSYLRYLCLLANSGVQHVLFTLFVFVSVVGSNMCYLRYLCLPAYSGVQHVLFTLFVFAGE